MYLKRSKTVFVVTAKHLRDTPWRAINIYKSYLGDISSPHVRKNISRVVIHLDAGPVLIHIIFDVLINVSEESFFLSYFKQSKP